MSAKKPDISQIRKYLNGELDAHAMHQLERQAQDDPFVMDALDGYEAATGLQHRPLDELDKRLQQRIDQSKVRRMIPWKYYAAAASILIVFTLGYLLWPAGQPPIAKEKLAVTVPPPDHKATKDTIVKTAAKESMLAAVTPPPASYSKVSRARVKPAAINNSAVAAPAVTEDLAENAAEKPMTAVAQATPPASGKIYIRGLAKTDNQDKAGVNNGYYSTKPDSTAYFVSGNMKKSTQDSLKLSRVLKEITIEGYGEQKKKDLTGTIPALNAQVLQGKVEGVQVTTPDRISGIVMDQIGMPLPGAHIGIEGTDKGTSTDVNGRFTITATRKEKLKIDYIGFQSQQVNAGPNENVKIALEPTTSSLSEVVVVGYGAAKKPIKEAHPRMGWEQFNKYLKARATVTEGKTGTVRLSFTVDEKGRLDNFHIDKGLNDTVNQQAIDLVKNGPVWAPDVTRQSKTVKLKIRFSKE